MFSHSLKLPLCTRFYTNTSAKNLVKDMVDILQNTSMTIPAPVSVPIVKPSIHLNLFAYDTSILTQFTEFSRRVGLSMGFVVPNAQTLKNKVKRWSVLASPHVHKTTWSQFERRIRRRLVTIENAHPDLMEKYLWYIRYHLPSTMWMEARMYHYENKLD